MSLKKKDEKGYMDFSDVEISKNFFEKKQDIEKDDYKITDDFSDNFNKKRKNFWTHIMENRFEDNLLFILIIGGIIFRIITWIQNKIK